MEQLGIAVQNGIVQIIGSTVPIQIILVDFDTQEEPEQIIIEIDQPITIQELTTQISNLIKDV